MSNKTKIRRKPNKPEWMIHYIANGYPCTCCGKITYPYLDHFCDAHTSGLKEKYNHPEFRVVIDYGINEVMRILNSFGEMVRQGRVFQAGDLVDGIYEDCQVHLDAIDEEGESEEALRVIIPDMNNRFPNDENCDPFFN